ncbi:Zn-ribbon domain-containing OB-fold protein [Salipiger sp.]|uniref:Zn-ribbon domain-containing OB-fold protein n=1 Tax=Salipiger sp. TaxID=2078585 RepID=UPI003A984562
MDTSGKLVNGDNKAFWEGARQHKLLIQKCNRCDSVQFPPRHHCIKCWEADLVMVECSGRGRVESYTIVRRAPLAAFRDKVPYPVAAILLEEGPRLMAGVIGEDALDVAIGDAVTVDFEEDADGNVLPQFRRA